jgi:hypothetical protein
VQPGQSFPPRDISFAYKIITFVQHFQAFGMMLFLQSTLMGYAQILFRVKGGFKQQIETILNAV